MAMTRSGFLDKDGTLIENLPCNADPARIRLADSAGDALRRLRQAGFRMFVVSNQSGIACGLVDEAAMAGVLERITQRLRHEDVVLDGFYYFPYWPHGRVAPFARTCDCRKPAPGMLLRAAREHGLTLAGSSMVGDILNDIEAGRRAGCRTVLPSSCHHEAARIQARFGGRRPDVFAGTTCTA